MASEDGTSYRIDPAEMLWQCSVCLACTGEGVVVEITKGTDRFPAARSSAGHLAPVASGQPAVPGAAYSPGLHPAHAHPAHPHAA